MYMYELNLFNRGSSFESPELFMHYVNFLQKVRSDS